MNPIGETPPPPAGPGPSRRVPGRVEKGVALVVAALILIRLGPQASPVLDMGPDAAVPAFTVVTLRGDTLHSRALEGKVVVVNFWATWCPPCRLEMPSLQRLHEDPSMDDVVVLGFSTDIGREGPIRTFLAERGITYPVGRATPAHREAFGGIPGIPATFLIDRTGVLRQRVVGYFRLTDMYAAVSRLVEERAPPVAP